MEAIHINGSNRRVSMIRTHLPSTLGQNSQFLNHLVAPKFDCLLQVSYF
jgi:hypothetical protein